MKKFLLFSFLTLTLTLNLLIGSANAQWWVRGGNLLWPYGNVEIAKDLNVGGVIDFDSTVTLDSVVIEDDLTVTGSIQELGVKELVVNLNWNLNSDPTVAIVKNTTGTTFTFDNIDDLGEQIKITANSGTPFTTGKTIFMSSIITSGGNVLWPVASYNSTSETTVGSYRNDGALVAIDDYRFIFHIYIFP